MGFNELPGTIQSLYIVNYELFGKLFILTILLFLSIYYISSIHKKTETPYIFVGIIKILLLLSSWIYLATFILFLPLLHPQVSLYTLYNFVLIIWWISFTIFMIFVIVNLFYYSPLYMMRLAGFDYSGEKGNKVFNKIDEYIFRSESDSMKRYLKKIIK